MGKKQQAKDEAPNPNGVVNRDVFQRLSFLYQASAYLKGLDRTDPTSSNETPKTQGDEALPKKGRKRRKASLGDLGRSYVRNMRTIGNKTVVRMDPNVKRTLCKSCDTVLIPGTTASVRVKGSPTIGHKVTYTCLECRTSRAIPAPPVTPTPLSDIASPQNPPITAALQDTVDVHGGSLFVPSDMQRFGKRKKRNPPVPRPLPLFARQDAGHVVFRGNEQLAE